MSARSKLIMSLCKTDEIREHNLETTKHRKYGLNNNKIIIHDIKILTERNKNSEIGNIEKKSQYCKYADDKYLENGKNRSAIEVDTSYEAVKENFDALAYPESQIHYEDSILEKMETHSGQYIDQNEFDKMYPPTPEDPFNISSDSNDALYHPSCSSDDDDVNIYNRNGKRKFQSKETCKTKESDNKLKNEASTYSLFNNKEESKKATLSDVHQEIEIPSSSNLLDNKPLKTKKSYKRKPDFCYFCETSIHNFARHIKRNHSMEHSVAKILALPVKSRERRKLFNNLRRKGNFLGSGQGVFKAVRQTYVSDRKLLPCDNCLGFFSSKLLYRHRKICSENSAGGAQAAGQARLITNLKIDRRLKDEVFPHMRSDKISLEAQNDVLICAFGSRYLNTHREKHFISVTSRKMRELSKLLLELKKLVPSITDMFSALKPENFDHFVEATKRISGYQADKDSYASPSFAMNIATSLKQCCDIAISCAYRKHTPYMTVSSAKAEADLKTVILLFETNWKFEVSSQAANTLNLNKWNRVTVIPLATDLKLFREFLLKMGDNAVLRLKNHDDIAFFNKLVESVYCRVILLNRKRSGELQRMYLHTYENSATKQEYQEFQQIVNPTEEILLKSFKRVVIRGKRGRGVPVLFSKDVQKHIKFVLDIRKKFVTEANPYLFARANSTQHIIGYKTLNKFAKCCGAKNPAAITSTRLRKHLATLTQLFTLSDGEIEQLATFMGHTPGVHRGSYRLPDDIYQTIKISKLLLIMEKGGSSEFKGKTLDEIEIDVEENLLNDDVESDQSDKEANEEESLDNNILPVKENHAKNSGLDDSYSVSFPKKQPRVLVSWTEKQKKFFENHINTCKPPKRKECEELKLLHPNVLNNKKWTKIKVFIQNEYRNKKTQ